MVTVRDCHRCGSFKGLSDLEEVEVHRHSATGECIVWDARRAYQCKERCGDDRCR